MLQTQLYTTDAFWEFCERPENRDRHFELIHGVILEMPSPSPLHGLIAAKLLHFIWLYLTTNDIGYGVGDNNDFILAQDVVLKPDVAYISKRRMPKIPLHYHLAPDIAIEVFSPSNSEEQLLEKTITYMQYGTQLVWVVYPETQIIWVYRPEPNGSLNLRKLTAADTLAADDLLPGFSLPIAAIFAGLEVENDL